MKLGLLGEKLPHSYSKRIFEELFGYPSYQLIELQPEELEAFVKSNDLDGFNVTVPYKTQILPFLQGVDEKAARIGAVNAVRREKDGFYGTNTDYDGLKHSINYGFQISPVVTYKFNKKSTFQIFFSILSLGYSGMTYCYADPLTGERYKERTHDVIIFSGKLVNSISSPKELAMNPSRSCLPVCSSRLYLTTYSGCSVQIAL